MIRFIIEHQELTGPINATTPYPMLMKDFCEILGEVLNRPFWLPMPEFLLRIVLGEMADMLLHGQRVIPKKLLNAGFEFKFPKLRSALENAIGNK
jgi:Predicted nucleoside-diphosphate sugar epimerase